MRQHAAFAPFGSVQRDGIMNHHVGSVERPKLHRTGGLAEACTSFALRNTRGSAQIYSRDLALFGDAQPKHELSVGGLVTRREDEAAPNLGKGAVEPMFDLGPAQLLLAAPRVHVDVARAVLTEIVAAQRF